MRIRPLFVVLMLLTVLLPAASTHAADQWVSDILANPARYWNTTVTITGQVITVTANPPGTTRGTYTLMDDSSQVPLVVRTKDLPPVGRNYAVTGAVIQDPQQAGVPILDELQRSEPGMSSLLKYGLWVAGAVLVALLVVLIVMMVKPKEGARPVAPATLAQTMPRPTTNASHTPPPARFDKTRKVPQAATADEAPDKTRVFMNLGAELVVDRGPDKGNIYPLHDQVTSIGRAGARKNAVELSDDTVSKEQASIYYDGGTQRFSIANESATNPTTVNKKLIAETTLLEPDAVIEIGATVLRFRKT